MLNVKQVAHYLRQLLGAQDIAELREELRPDYVISRVPAPDSRIIGLWCKDKAAADKAVAYFIERDKSFTLIFNRRDDIHFWSIRFQGTARTAQTIIDELEQIK